MTEDLRQAWIDNRLIERFGDKLSELEGEHLESLTRWAGQEYDNMVDSIDAAFNELEIERDIWDALDQTIQMEFARLIQESEEYTSALIEFGEWADNLAYDIPYNPVY